MTKGEISCKGRVNGMGEDDPSGSYVLLIYSTPTSINRLIVSEGAAELLAGEITGALEQKSDAALAQIMRGVRGV